MSTFPQTQTNSINYQQSFTKQTPLRYQSTPVHIQSPQINSSRQVMSEFRQLLSQTNSLYEQFSSLEKQLNPSSHVPSKRNTMNNNALFYETNDISNILPNTNVKQISHVYNDNNNVLEDDVDVIGSSPLEEDNDNDNDIDIDHNENVCGDDDSSINLDEIANEIEDYYNGEDYKLQQVKRMEEDMKKVKNANQVLMRSNIELRNNNKLLENEIKSYKASGLVDRKGIKGNGNNGEYDGSLSRFLEGLKNSLCVSLEKNLYLMEQINGLIRENNKLIDENMQLGNNYGQMVNQYEYSNKQHLEI